MSYLLLSHARLLWAVLASALLSAPLAQAQDVGEPERLRFSGFATAGVLHADVDEPWAFRRDVMQEPKRRWLQHAVDSRLGLQLNARLAERWEAVGQLVLKDQADETPDAQRIEWAFLAYRPRPDLTVRLGRMNQDVFLLSQYSSVGYAYPWVRPITPYYAWMAFTAVDGLDATQRWRSGDAAWTLRGMVGQNDLTLAGVAGESLDYHGRDAMSLSLAREQGGLLLRLSYLRLRAGFSGSLELGPLFSALAGVQAAYPSAAVREQAGRLAASITQGTVRSQYFGAGARYTTGPWEVHGEITRADSQADAADALSGYLSVGYRFGDVMLFGVAARAKALNPPVEQPAWPASIAPLGEAGATLANLARHDMTSGSLGLRWDFHQRTALKLQWDQIHTHRWGGTMWGNATSAAQTANVYTVVVDTVF